MNDTKNELETLSEKADLVIHKYALMAGVSGAIPISVVDAVGDTACQLGMIYEIQDIYQIKMSKTDLRVVIGVVIDNLIPQKVISKIASLLKVIPGVGTVIGSMTKSLVDFITTLCIGQVCKQIFEYMHVHNLQPNKEIILGFVKAALTSSLSYMKSNWKTILSAEKYLLPKYEVDLKRELATFKKTLNNNSKTYESFLRLCHETNKDFIEMIDLTGEKLIELDKLCTLLATPSIDLIIAELKMKRLKGIPLTVDESAFIDLAENSDVVIKGLHNILIQEEENV